MKSTMMDDEDGIRSAFLEEVYEELQRVRKENGRLRSVLQGFADENACMHFMTWSACDATKLRDDPGPMCYSCRAKGALAGEDE